MPFSFDANSTGDAAGKSASSRAKFAPHRSNAALRSRSDSRYQQRNTQRENPAQMLIKQAVDHLIAQLEAGKSEALTAYLTTMARFHSYSFGNILAIARQKPDAQRVAGIRTWNELGRFVKKGEKGIQILAPMNGYRRSLKDETAKQNTEHKPPCVLIGFRAVYVFERLSRDLRPRFYALGLGATHLGHPAMAAISSPNLGALRNQLSQEFDGTDPRKL